MTRATRATGIGLIWAGALLQTAVAAEKDPDPAVILHDRPVESYGRHIQRTMRLLSESTETDRRTVRILFFGQSITEQGWWKVVADHLRIRYPQADLVIENRAIGGHSAQQLVRTIETEVSAFYPDLVIFHAFGSEAAYEQIIRRIRRDTTAEIMIQSDHLLATESIDEPTDPAVLTKKQWNPWMNYVFLPQLADRYGLELVDQRNLWKQYLRRTGLSPQSLLKDDTHLNDLGESVMAEIVRPYLRSDARFDADTGASGSIVTTLIDVDDPSAPDTRRIRVRGNRIDVSAAPGTTADVWIDGERPSEISDLRFRTRTTPFPDTRWPCLLRSTSRTPPIVESWSATVFDLSDDHRSFRFRVEGSVTGPDGEGKSGVPFRSRSGRVEIDPEDWNLGYGRKIHKRTVTQPFTIKWEVRTTGVDRLGDPKTGPVAADGFQTIGQGLENTEHVVEFRNIRGTIRAVRSYVPPVELPVPFRDTMGNGPFRAALLLAIGLAIVTVALRRLLGKRKKRNL